MIASGWVSQGPRVREFEAAFAERVGALDAVATGAVEETLLELRERLEISIVLVTHDLDQARRMSDWLVRIDGGRAIEQGPTDELLRAAGVR